MPTATIRKMKEVSIGLSLIFLLGSTTAHAQQSIFIRGFTSCGKWIEEKSPSTKHGQTMWFLGYLSGISMGLNKDLIRHADVESIVLWVDNYCRANPLKDTGDAGSSLALELGKK